MIPGHLCIALSYRILNYTWISKYYHSIAHHSNCKMTPVLVFNHGYLSCFFTASLFSSNLQLSGKRFRSGPLESFCRSMSCNVPNGRVYIWDGAWLVQGALSPVKRNYLSECVCISAWKLLEAVLKYSLEICRQLHITAVARSLPTVGSGCPLCFPVITIFSSVFIRV